MKRSIFIVVLMSFSLGSISQEVGSWWMYFGNFRFNDQFSIWTEAQYRSYDHGENIEQMMLRSALNYHISKKSIATFGYGYIGNYLPGTDINNPTIEEDRIYQQFVQKHSIPLVLIEHRFRLEQRWPENTYRNRIRYRIFLTIPLNKKDIEAKTWFLGLYDELFLNTVEKYYDRNRFYFALGRQFNEYLNLQVGMLNQDTQFADKWYFQLAMSWNVDFRK